MQLCKLRLETLNFARENKPAFGGRNERKLEMARTQTHTKIHRYEYIKEKKKKEKQIKNIYTYIHMYIQININVYIYILINVEYALHCIPRECKNHEPEISLL